MRFDCNFAEKTTMALHVFCKPGQNVRLKEALFEQYNKSRYSYETREWQMDSDGKMHLLDNRYRGKAHFIAKAHNGTGILSFTFVETVEIVERGQELYYFFHKILQETLRRNFHQYFYMMQNIPTDLPTRPELDARFPYPVKSSQREASMW